jgi:hypothetical protein
MAKWLFTLITLLVFVGETLLVGDGLRKIVSGDKTRSTWGWFSLEVATFLILLSVIW